MGKGSDPEYKQWFKQACDMDIAVLASHTTKPPAKNSPLACEGLNGNRSLICRPTLSLYKISERSAY